MGRNGGGRETHPCLALPCIPCESSMSPMPQFKSTSLLSSLLPPLLLLPSSLPSCPLPADNLKVWRVATGELVAGFASAKPHSSSSWPLLKWSQDERVAARLTSEGVSFLDGTFSAAEQSVRTAAVSKIANPAITAFWMGPCSASGSVALPVLPGGAAAGAAGAAAGGAGSSAPSSVSSAPFLILTFVPRSKSKPASVASWAWPRVTECIGSKSLQADSCQVKFSHDGGMALVEMRTESSADSY